MEAQEIFDRVWKWFVTDRNPRGVSGNGYTCIYRGDRDPQSPIRCAIGCLLEDAEYDSCFEENRVGTLFRKGLLPERFNTHEELLRNLQVEHDGCAHSMEGALRRVAVRFGLIVPS